MNKRTFISGSVARSLTQTQTHKQTERTKFTRPTELLNVPIFF